MILQLPIGRHLNVAVADGIDDEALLEIAGNDRRAGVAPFEHRLAGIEPQLGELLDRAVALEAVFDEERADAGFKELDTCGLGIGG